jgi:hypothetical protein
MHSLLTFCETVLLGKFSRIQVRTLVNENFINIYLIVTFVVMYWKLSWLCRLEKTACSTNLVNWSVFIAIIIIDFCIVLGYIRCERVQTDNNSVGFHDSLRENDNPKNPVPTVVERRFVGEIGENEESSRENYFNIEIQIGETGNNNIDEIIPMETQTRNDNDIIILD